MAESDDVYDPDSSVPLSWVVVFLLLVFGVGAAAILFLGGSVLP